MAIACIVSYPLEGQKVRLERNHQSVLRLLEQMNSYRYEPRSYEGFVRLQDIRMGLRALAAEQRLLLETIQGALEDGETAQVKAEKCIGTFRALEKDIAAYRLETKTYHGPYASVN